MPLCPLCKKEYNLNYYHQKGCCSECGEFIKNIPTNTIYKKKSGMQPSKKYSLKTTVQSPTTEVPVITHPRNKHLEYEEKTQFKKTNENQSKKIKEDHTEKKKVTTRKLVSMLPPGAAADNSSKLSVLDNENTEQKKFDGSPRTIASSDLSKKNSSEGIDNNTEEYKKKHKFSFKVWIKKRKEQNIEKRIEQLESDMEFHFNDDHYYDDVETIETVMPDIISKTLILKIIGVIGILVLGTAFLIYYA